jgi:hypothetical protein
MGKQKANDRDHQARIEQLVIDLQRYGESLQQTLERLDDLEGEWLATIARLRELERSGEGTGAAEVEAHIGVLCREFRVIRYRTERYEKVRDSGRKMLELLQKDILKEGMSGTASGC